MLGVGFVVAVEPEKANFERDILPLIEDHCFGCHGDGQEKGGIRFDSFKTAGDIHRGYKLWEQVLRKVRAGEMPPEGRKKRPNKDEQTLIAGWIRHKDGRQPDVSSLLLFVDCFPPSPLGALGAVGWVPSVELTVHVRCRPAPGWIKASLRTDDLTEGRMIETGCFWDSTGALVAQSRQLALVRD